MARHTYVPSSNCLHPLLPLFTPHTVPPLLCFILFSTHPHLTRASTFLIFISYSLQLHALQFVPSRLYLGSSVFPICVTFFG